MGFGGFGKYMGGLNIVQSVIGGVVMMVVGLVVYAVYNFNIPLLITHLNVGTVLDKVNPLCIMNGFKGCDTTPMRTLNILIITYALIAGIYAAAFVFKVQEVVLRIFPPLPLIIGAISGLMWWLLLKSVAQSKSTPATVKKITDSRLFFAMFCLLGAACTMPLTIILFKMLKRHSNHPHNKYNGSIENMAAMHQSEAAALAARHNQELALMGVA